MSFKKRIFLVGHKADQNETIAVCDCLIANVLVLKTVDIPVRIDTTRNEITSLSPTGESTKLHAGIALRGNFCFVFYFSVKTRNFVGP